MESLLKHYFSKISLTDFSTPAYLYFPSQLKENIRSFKKFEESDIPIFFAVKASNYPPLIKELAANNFGFDIASKEELELIHDTGTDPSRITFSAPSKREEDLHYANKIGVKYYAFDSEEEIKKIVSIVKDPYLFARIAVYNKDAVFNLSTKFGMYEEYFFSIVRKAKKMKWPLHGLTFHVGSQNISSKAWSDALKHTLRLLMKTEEMGVTITHINLGGGIPAQYEKNIPDVDYYISRIILFCRKIKKRFPEIQFSIEPGRALCANTMALITRVIDIKPYKKPPLLIVNSSVFNGMIEPLEHFEYPIYAGHFTNIKKQYYRIGGFSCDGYDVMKHKVLLPKDIKIGDLIIFMYSGAYTFVYYNFHMVPYPEIKFIEN
jgi:ornithine decarboxylase